MPRVPTYDDLSVGASTLRPTNIQPLEMPTNAGETASQIGDGMLSLGTGLNKVALRQKRLDDQASFDKAKTEWLQREFEWGQANNELRGEDAFEITSRYNKDATSWTSEFILKVPQSMRRDFENDMTLHRLTSASKYANYEAGQKHEFRLTEKGKLLAKYTNLYVYATTYEEEKNAHDNIVKEARLLADLNGINDESLIQQNIDEALSDAYVGRINQMMSTAPQTALGYFMGKRDAITDPKVRSSLEKDVREAAKKSEVQVYVTDNFDNLTREDVTKKYKNDAPEVLSHALAMWDQMDRSRKEDLEAKQTSVRNSLYDQWESSRDLTKLDPDMMRWAQKYDPATHKALIELAQGKDIVTDEKVFSELMMQRFESPLEFRDLDMSKFRGVLSPTDYRRLEGYQKDVDKDADVLSENTQLTNLYNAAGLGSDSNGRKKKARLADAYATLKQEWMRANGGKQPLYEDRQRMMDSLLLEGEVTKPGAWIDPDKDYYEVVTGNAEDRKFWVPDIPSDVRKDIIAELKANNLIADDANIMRAYRIMYGMSVEDSK